ncbi:MAG TPA: BlaI/MecI/CopY family transcriptional regulator [Phycisphaerae bacterium]|nr:BlaI/MecI/CopY family transcriptional regulator [Phycisphaerae bacterium]
MPRRSSSHPTEAELEVLNVLWQLGPATVRQVHQTLQADRTTSLTTTLKLLQVMTEKGLTVRDREAHPHRYAPAVSAEKTQAGLVDDLVQRAFSGSARQLVVRAVEEGDLSPEELGEIRRLIDHVRKGKRGEKR